jgi:hypothetical protein
MPAQLWKQCQRNKDKEDAIAMTTKTYQRCHHDEGDDTIVAWAMTPAQQCSAVAIVLLIVIVGLCLSSSPRLKRNWYYSFWGDWRENWP